MIIIPLERAMCGKFEERLQILDKKISSVVSRFHKKEQEAAERADLAKLTQLLTYLEQNSELKSILGVLHDEVIFFILDEEVPLQFERCLLCKNGYFSLRVKGSRSNDSLTAMEMANYLHRNNINAEYVIQKVEEFLEKLRQKHTQ